MLNDKESPFTLTLTDGELRLPVLRFSGEEALNQPFRFDVEVIGLAPAIPPGALLHQPAFLRMGEQQGVHGVIHCVTCDHRGSHRVGYRLVLVPHLQRLAQSPVRRVFVQSSVPAILAQLLAEHDLPADSFRIELTVGHYPPRDFCIQYEESDLALLQRLCEEEGIHYHFEHGPEGHVVVFADDSLSLPQTPVLIPFNTDDGETPRVNSLFQRHDAAPSVPQHDVRNRGQQAGGEDAANQTVAAPSVSTMSAQQRHAEQRSRRHLERQRCQYRSVHGRSDSRQLRSGHLLQVTRHPVSGFNEQWLITELRHHGQQPSILDPAPVEYRYHNDFSALPWSTDFRPPLKQARPRIPGYHLARVLGPTGLPTVLDEQGRINVSVWPTSAVGDDQGIWLPIALTHAHGRLAAHDLPRTGSEVWVSFLDSDPDRPILCLGTQRDSAQVEVPSARDSSLLLDWLINRS
jgi:type VI secretion system secreted protein VgrG